GQAVDSYAFVAPEASHDAGLGDLSFEDSERAIALLRAWVEVPGTSARAGQTWQAWQAWQALGERVSPRPRLGL
ncbi:MAG TPA: hypothetical protein VNM90_18460, partial [Haliangium sp.]|nr:hypothetical protein [Haliangium sp.]